MTSRLDEHAPGLVERWAHDAVATRGQIYMSVDGEPRVDLAWGRDGLGRAIEPDTPFRIYCAGKPVLAVALCAAAEAGLLRIDDPLGAYLDGTTTTLAACRLVDVLAHRAGLGGGGGFAAGLAPPPVRRALALAQEPEPGPHPSSYSEYVGWELLAAVVEAITGGPVDVGVDRLLGASDAWTAPRLGTPDDLGVNVLWRGDRCFPMLAERYVPEPWARNAALGWVASMRTLGRFAEQLVECAAAPVSSCRPGARTVSCQLFARQDRAWDRMLQRWSTFGAGVMLDVADHYFGDGWSERSFGHAGFAGVTWFAGDPVRQIVVAAHLVDVIEANEAVMVRRPRVARDLFALLGAFR